MDKQLQDLIKNDELGAITIDTSIFDAQKHWLESGLLQRVEQFRDYAIEVLMVDVVTDELVRHMADAARSASQTLAAALREVEGPWFVTAETRSQIKALVDGGLSPLEKATARVAGWLDRTHATQLAAAEWLSLAQVMERYYAATPPFAANETKKYEFPDALALLTLEAWAQQQSRKVLVVSNDGDWKRFCEKSAWLIFRNDLSAVLGAFQQPTARFATRRIAQLLAKGDPVGLAAAIEGALQAQDDRVEFDIEMSSSYHVEHDISEPEFDKVELPAPRDAESEFEAIDYTNGVLVIHVPFTAYARVGSSFEFSMWEGVDREYLPMGSCRLVTSEAIGMEALVSIGGKIPEQMTVTSVQILPTSHHIDLGNIRPDWMNDEDNDNFNADDDSNFPDGGLF